MPLTFDFSLEKCKTYRGTNPRPADFDAFWESSLAEMRSIKPEVELVPADFAARGVECFHLYFTGTGGARIHAKLVRPQKSDAPHPAVLMFHGYTVDSGDWSDKLAFASQGFTVAALDVRGQAGLSEDHGIVSGNTVHGHIIRGLDDALRGRPEKLLFRQIFLDTAQLAKIVMEMPDVDPNRVGATGWSQGGGLTVACAALEPRIQRMAPVYPFLSDYQRVWDMDEAKDAYLEIKDYFRHSNPRHEDEAKVFETLGYIDIHHLAPRIRAEVLWSIGLMDTICPPSSQFAAYNNIQSKKRMDIYPDFIHEHIRGANDRIFAFLTGM
jgi:cephalosporin-C deacetylase